MRRNLTTGQKAFIAKDIANLPHGFNRFTKVDLTNVKSTPVSQPEAAAMIQRQDRGLL